METNVRNFAGHIMESEPVVDLGQPQTPRKTVDGSGGTRLLLRESIGENRADGLMAPRCGDGLLTMQRRMELAASGQAVEFDSKTIAIDGRMWETMDVLADIRKQLMVMGLFPPELYRVGENFEETRLR